MDTVDFCNHLASHSHNSGNNHFDASYPNSDELVSPVPVVNKSTHLHMLPAQNFPSSANPNVRQLPESTHGIATSNSGLPRDLEVGNHSWTGDTWPSLNAISQEISTVYNSSNSGTRDLFDSCPDSEAINQEEVRMVDDLITLPNWPSLSYNPMLSCITENFLPIALSRDSISTINIISDDSIDIETTYLDWTTTSVNQKQSTQPLFDPLLSTLPYDLQQWPGEAKTTDIVPLEILALEQAYLSDAIVSGTWEDSSQVIPDLFTSDPLLAILPSHLDPSKAVSSSTDYDLQILGFPESLLDRESPDSRLTIHRSEILQHTFQNHNTGAITSSSTTEVIQSFAKPLGPNLDMKLRRKQSNLQEKEYLSSKGVRTRRPFQSIEDKQETSQTRERKACVRCRMQRIRVRLHIHSFEP